MLASVAAFATVGLALLSGANADISILFPHAGATWYTNDTVSLNWTAAPTDNFDFQPYIQNEDLQYAPAQLAQTFNASGANGDAHFVRFSLGQVPSGDGFIVTLHNVTNSSQIFATSEKFKIEAGITPTTSTSAGPSVAPTVGNIPNAKTTAAAASSSAANPFASDKASAATRSQAPYVVGAVMAVVGAAIVL